MKIEDQVCSLELAKRLKELDVKQESIYRYFGGGHDATSWVGAASCDAPEICSAFTVAEMGELMPPNTPSEKTDHKTFLCYQQISEEGDDTFWDEKFIDTDLAPEMFTADTEADARAKMLIYLIEQKLVKP